MNYWECNYISENVNLSDEEDRFINLGLLLALSDSISKKSFPTIYLIENEIILERYSIFFGSCYFKLSEDEKIIFNVKKELILKQYSIKNIVKLIEEEHKQLKHIYGCIVPICIIREVFINIINNKDNDKFSSISFDLDTITIIRLVELCNPSTTISQQVTKILKEYLDNVKQQY